jgi:hypothetical protein
MKAKRALFIIQIIKEKTAVANHWKIFLLVIIVD